MTDQSEEITNPAQERYCIHYRAQPPGNYYTGTEYVAALERLRGNAAMRAASNVEAFFWRDAAVINVWLCHECANVVGLETGPAYRS
jgi:hypothetical protein